VDGAIVCAVASYSGIGDMAWVEEQVRNAHAP
jgi:hypothetical protein